MESASFQRAARARRPRTFVHRPSLVACIALFACAAASCVGAPPDVAPERALAEAVALDASFALRAEGDPLDAPLVAQGAAAPNTLPFRVALESALVSSAELQAELARVQRALAAADEARLLANPVLDVVLRAPAGGGRAVV